MDIKHDPDKPRDLVDSAYQPSNNEITQISAGWRAVRYHTMPLSPRRGGGKVFGLGVVLRVH